MADVDWVESGGPESILVSGGVASIVHVWRAGLGSSFPAASRARTSKACVPSPRPVYVAGEEQLVNAAPSSEHRNVELGSLEKLKLAEELRTRPDGLSVIVVSGGVVSTVQVLVAGLSSRLPALSRARTWNVCVPSLRPV